MNRKTLRPLRRVMLIFPPMMDVKYVDTMACPPMGIASLAAFVREEVEIKLLDAVVEGYHRRIPVSPRMELVGLSFEDILKRVKEYQPDLVGFSCVFSNQFAAIRELSKRIKKEIDPEMVLVAGGTHPSFLPERALRTTALDYVVLSEGELTFRELLRAHNTAGSSAFMKIEELDGLAFRDGDRITVNPRVHYIENLDELPFPARDLLPIEKYFEINVPMGLHWRKRRNLPIVTSRGCPCQCTFCSSTIHWGKRYRSRSPESVLQEIEHLRSVYGVEELKFQDDNLTLPRKRAEAIFSGMVERGLVMPWNTPNGVAIWTLDEPLIKLMKESGCYEFTLAVESGDQWVLENIVKKPLKLEKAKEVARLARQHGLSTVGYFIIGFPGENMEQIRRTLRFALELKLDYIISFIYNPLPGSELWNLCREKGYISEDYHYEDANNYFQSDLNTENFNSKELNRLQEITYLRNLVKMPFRNPREFFRYYSQLLRTRPSFLRTFLLAVLRYPKPF